MSTNRTLVDLIARNAVGCSEGADLTGDAPLKVSEALELGVSIVDAFEEIADQAAHRRALPCRLHASAAVDLVGDAHGDVLHSRTVSQPRS